jgi:hypothetical protein
MRRKFVAVLLLMMGWGLKAQVTMTVHVPPLGLTVKPQLWNLLVMNTSSQPINIQVDLVMTDAGTSQTVMTATTPHVLLPAGMKRIGLDDVNPVHYQAGAGYALDADPNGFLPVGVFNLCYSITKWTNDISEQIAEECVTVEVEPLSPPQLVQPGDSDQIAFTRPFFTWLPPAPLTQFLLMNYDWMLVEVLPTQSGSDAIQQNMPLLTQSNISFSSFQYPLSMPELDTSKLYAWRVTAKNNGMVVANSEIWSFRVQPYVNDSISRVLHALYSPLRREKDGSYVIGNGVLHYQYLHEMSTVSVQLSITDISSANHRRVELDSANQAVTYGANYLQLDLREVDGMINKHLYLLELVNDRQERWYLKFEYRKTEEN